MAYTRRRRSSYRTRRTSSRRPARRSYGRRRTSYARRRRSTGRTQRIVIQVIGGPGGVATSPVTLGSKSARPVRARF